MLAGVKSVSLLDNEPTELRDLSAQFYLTEADVGKPRAHVSLPMLRSLNPHVAVGVVDEPLSLALLGTGQFQVRCKDGMLHWRCCKSPLKPNRDDSRGILV